MNGPSSPAPTLPTRQKSCDSCVQSKRRCDRRTPVCSVCAKRKVACTYRNAPVKGTGRPTHHVGCVTGSAETAHSEVEEPAFDAPFPSLDLETADPESLLMNVLPDGDPRFAHFDSGMSDVDFTLGGMDIPMDALLRQMDDGITADSETKWLVPVDQAGDDALGSPIDEEISMSYDKISAFSGCCVSLFTKPHEFIRGFQRQVIN